MSETLEGNMLMKSNQAPFEECAATLKALSLPGILQEIFDHLDFQSKGRAAQVSWLWRNTIERPKMICGMTVIVKDDFCDEMDPSQNMIAPSEYLKITNFMNSKQNYLQPSYWHTTLMSGVPHELSDNVRIIIVHNFRDLVSLEESNQLGNFSDLGLTYIADNLKSLCHLELINCSDITDKGVAALCGINMAESGNIPRLHSLSLTRNHALTDEALKFLSIGQPELRNLNLSLCSQITDSGLEFLSRLFRLKSLNVEGCTAITDMGMAHIAHIANLTDCNLSWNNSLTISGLELLAFGNSRLSSLTLKICPKVNDHCGPPLARLTNLTKLNLSGTCIGDRVLQCLANGPGAIRLNTLNLNKCYKLTDAAGTQLARFTNLTKLILSSTHIGDCVLQCLANGPGAMTLDTLDLSECYKLTNAAGQSLACLTKLTKLILDYTNIGDTVLKCLANGTGVMRLDTLCLKNCRNITKEAGQHLAMMTNLQVVDLSGSPLSTKMGRQPFLLDSLQ